MSTCTKCGGDIGPTICKTCVTDFVDRVIQDDRRSRGDLGFKPMSEEGANLVMFMIEAAGMAVDELHAVAAAMQGANPDLDNRVRKVADELWAVRKKAKAAVLLRQ